MITPDVFTWIATRLGVDRGRAVANARPHPVRLAQDRHEQYRAIRQQMASPVEATAESSVLRQDVTAEPIDERGG